MAEEKRAVSVRTVEYVCDACGEGHMKPTCMCLPSNPPQYPHACDKCGECRTFNVIYPRTEYRAAEFSLNRHPFKGKQR